MAISTLFLSSNTAIRRYAHSELRRKQMELNWSLADLQNKFGEHNPQVLAARAGLATVNKQIDGEAEHILGNMKNAYDIARAAGAIARGEPPEPHRES